MSIPPCYARGPETRSLTPVVVATSIRTTPSISRGIGEKVQDPSDLTGDLDPWSASSVVTNDIQKNLSGMEGERFSGGGDVPNAADSGTLGPAGSRA